MVPPGHCSPVSRPRLPAPRSTLRVPRRDQRGQVVRRPFPAGYCLTPTAELPRILRGPITPTGPPLLGYHRMDDSCGQINPSSPLAAARLLTIRSWPEALNASGSRRASRMTISRNACSLLYFPYPPDEFTRVGLVLRHTSQDSYPLHDIAWNSAWRALRSIVCVCTRRMGARRRDWPRVACHVADPKILNHPTAKERGLGPAIANNTRHCQPTRRHCLSG